MDQRAAIVEAHVGLDDSEAIPLQHFAGLLLSSVKPAPGTSLIVFALIQKTEMMAPGIPFVHPNKKPVQQPAQMRVLLPRQQALQNIIAILAGDEIVVLVIVGNHPETLRAFTHPRKQIPGIFTDAVERNMAQDVIGKNEINGIQRNFFHEKIADRDVMNMLMAADVFKKSIVFRRQRVQAPRPQPISSTVVVGVTWGLLQASQMAWETPMKEVRPQRPKTGSAGLPSKNPPDQMPWKESNSAFNS